jgi:hypothetical protein
MYTQILELLLIQCNREYTLNIYFNIIFGYTKELSIVNFELFRGYTLGKKFGVFHNPSPLKTEGSVLFVLPKVIPRIAF